MTRRGTRSRERWIVQLDRLLVVQHDARTRAHGRRVHEHLGWAPERLPPDREEVPDRVRASHGRLDVNQAARVVRVDRLEAPRDDPDAGGDRDLDTVRENPELGVPVIHVVGPAHAGEGLGRTGIEERGHVVRAEDANRHQGDERHLPRPHPDRGRVLRRDPARFRLQPLPDLRSVRMAGMRVVQMAEQVLPLDGDVADRTSLGVRHGLSTPSAPIQCGRLFRNAVDASRTHAYMAPEESGVRIGFSPKTFSTARSKSVIVTTSRSSRIANMPASVHIAWMSAPVAPSHRPARMPGSTSDATFIVRAWIRKIVVRASWFGMGISMIRSKRPGRRSASSRMSGRFVAPMIFTSPSGLNPSSSARSCMSVRWTSRSPDVAISSRFAPTESSSSMNTIDGAFSRASWNSSRTSRAPSPMYFCTSSEPTNRMNVALVRFATAFARSVLPVPGGPTRRTPFGGSMPTFR